MQTGMRHTASRVWYVGAKHADGSIEESSKSYTFPAQDLSNRSTRSTGNARFTYSIANIDEISRDLGIPLETSKDQPFAASTIYIGFVWNLDRQTVALSPTKTAKYTNEINEWLAR